MPFTIKVDLIEDTLTAGLPRFRKKLPMALRTVLHKGAISIEGSSKLSLVRGAKTGKVYKRRSVTHRASAPGQAPASDTGDLLNHITRNLGRDFAEVGATKQHGLHLELGAPSRNLAARPWLLPALQEHEPSFEGDLIRELSRR